MQACLFCGGDGSDPDHIYRCDGRQGRIEARDDSTTWDQNERRTRAPVLDRVEASRVTEIGIARSTAHTPEETRADLARLVETVARQRATLTSDDVWVAARDEGIDLATCRPSALGGVFRAVASAGIIMLTNERQESRRPAHHRKPLRVWRSCVFPEMVSR